MPRPLLALGLAVALVLLVLVVVAGARAVGYYKRTARLRFHPEPLTRAHAHARSGDVVLFIAHAHGFSNSVLTRCPFSHAGVVVVIDDEPFVSESTPGFELAPGVRLPAGPQLTPLSLRAAHYQGSCFLMRLRGAEGADARITAALLRAHVAAVPYPAPAAMGAAALLGAGAAAGTAHCFQHAAALLSAAGCATEEVERAGYLGAANAIADMSVPDPKTGLQPPTLKNGGWYEPPCLLVNDAVRPRALVETRL